MQEEAKEPDNGSSWVTVQPVRPKLRYRNGQWLVWIPGQRQPSMVAGDLVEGHRLATVMYGLINGDHSIYEEWRD